MINKLIEARIRETIDRMIKEKKKKVKKGKVKK